MEKTFYIESKGHLVYTMFGDRYELVGGKHKVLDVIPDIGGAPDESEIVRKQRIAQKIKAAFPQKITLSVEYEGVETPVEAAPEVPTPAPEAKKAGSGTTTKLPAAKKAVKAKK